MSEEKEKKELGGWSLYAVRKVVEYAALFLAVWQLGIPAAENYIEDRIKAYEEEHSSSKSFRSLLAEETGLKEDRLHIEFGNWWRDYSTLKDSINHVMHHIDDEIHYIMPRLIVRNHREYWIASDGHEYEVHRSSDGTGSYYAHGQWNFIFR